MGAVVRFCQVGGENLVRCVLGALANLGFGFVCDE